MGGQEEIARRAERHLWTQSLDFKAMWNVLVSLSISTLLDTVATYSREQLLFLTETETSINLHEENAKGCTFP